jgi:hypothetical protein
MSALGPESEVSVGGEFGGRTVEKTPSNLPPHLIPLFGGQWALWRTVGVRAAGFPANGVLRLSCSECAAAVDRMIVAQEEVDTAQRLVLQALGVEIEALKRPPRQTDTKKRLDFLIKAVRQVKQGKCPEGWECGSPAAGLMEHLRTASARVESLSLLVTQAFAAGLVDVSRALREIAGDRLFHEALLWQNRTAWHTGIETYRQKPGGNGARSSKRRQSEELIANYWQRYCVKNDTIGFFGPMGWAEFVSEGEPISLQPGASLTASRGVYFESWAVDALAEVLGRRDRMRLWAAPRRVPYVCSHRGTFLLAGAPLQLTVKERAILQACDGTKLAKQLAGDLLQTPGLGFGSEEEIYHLLSSICDMGLIRWSFEVPLERQPERVLREMIERIGEDTLRNPAVEALNELETSRDAVANAAGDPDRLDRELENLEQIFRRLTGKASTRAHGQTYAARTLVYEDCRRDVEVKLGPELVRNLEQPLSLVLTSTRWLSSELTRVCRKAMREVYDDLVRRSRSSVVEAMTFWSRVEPLLFNEKTRLADRVFPAFRRRWADILSLPPNQRRVVYSSEQLRSHVEAAFPAPRSDWSQANVHSPDVMIVARDEEAIRQGEYEWVLGELHPEMNSLNGVLFLAQHPHPEEIHQAIQADSPRPGLKPLPPKNFRFLTVRTGRGFVPPQDYRLEIALTSLPPTGSKSLPIGSLVVEAIGSHLVLRTRDGSLQFEVADALREFLSPSIVHAFSIFSSESRHTPRIMIDRLILCRESWRFSPAELTFASEESEIARFVAIRRWKCAMTLPRFLFVKTPFETKPFYVDLDSPVYANILARAIRKAREKDQTNSSLISLTEMVPEHAQTWLSDSRGNHYTSELRLVAVDLAA